MRRILSIFKYLLKVLGMFLVFSLCIVSLLIATVCIVVGIIHICYSQWLYAITYLFAGLFLVFLVVISPEVIEKIKFRWEK